MPPLETGYDMRMTNFVSKLSATAAVALTGFAASAQEVNQDLPIIGQPVPNGIDFQPAATSIAEDLQWLDGLLLIIITAIVIFVTGLLAIVIVRYNRRSNPTPATFTHNSPLEVAWTIVPVFILVVIGAFSLPVLFNQQEIQECEITIKVTGYQWYWNYEYVDDAVAFDSYMLGHPATTTAEATPFVLDAANEQLLADYGYDRGQWLLATDTAVVVPVGATIVMQVTAADVIHSWTIPAFGVKQDAVPGRLAELWFEAKQEGIYFGQCSELCGKDHAYMPITVKVVSQEVYDEWLAAAKEEFPA